MQFVDLARQYKRLQPDIDQRIREVLEHGRYVMGPEIAELEEHLASLVGVKHAICVANGTDALVLALMALGIGPGHAVIVPTFTFFASAEAISLVGAVPVFVDIEARSFNLDPQSVENAIKKTVAAGKLQLKAIITVDLFGLPANYVAISALASEYGLNLIEDAAQGIGGAIGDRKAGCFGNIATASFFPAKPLGCYGDGGAVLTDDNSLAELVCSLRQHGQGTDRYDNVRIGMNSRLDSIQAAVLLEKLTIFEDELERRNEVASMYSSLLQEKFVVPQVPANYKSAWAQYTIRPRSNGRDYYRKKLQAKGIPTAVYYDKPLHLQPAFSDLGNNRGLCPVAEDLADEVFSIPMHPYLESDEIASIATVLRD